MRIPLKMFAVGTLVVAGLAVSTAQGAETGSYVGVLGAHVNTDKDRRAKDGLGIHLLYGWRSEEKWGVEGQLFSSVLHTEESGGPNSYQQSLGLDFTYTFARNAYNFSPFLLAGLGIVRNDTSPYMGDSDTGLYGNVGAGFLGPEFGGFGVRVRGEVRHVHDDFMGGSQDTRFGLGVVIPIGSRPERAIVVERVVEPPAQGGSEGELVSTSVLRADFLAQEAQRRSLHQEPEVQVAMALAARERLVRELLARHLQENPVTEPEVRALYRQFVQASQNEQYLIRQYTATSQAEAQRIIEVLNAGSEQEVQSLAGSESLWVTLDMFTDDIAVQLKALKIGEASEPIEASGRWRVVRLLDRQQRRVGTLEELRPVLRERLERDRLANLIQQLRGQRQ